MLKRAEFMATKEFSNKNSQNVNMKFVIMVLF